MRLHLFRIRRCTRFSNPWKIFGVLLFTTVILVLMLEMFGGQTDITIPEYSPKQNFLSFVNIKGMQLGNELFLYASLLGISQHYPHLSPVIPDHLEIRKIFNLTMKIKKTPFMGAYFEHKNEKANTFDSEILQYPPPFSILIRGYLQSWKYFAKYEDLIRREFTFQKHILDQVEKRVESLIPKTYTGFKFVRVGIHVRRGDMITHHVVQYGYTTVDSNYITKAMEYFRDRYHKVLFVVCSDDIIWSQQNIHGDDVVFAEGGDYVSDFALLATSDHMIMSVGSFGWWAAWLTNGTTIYYKNWPRPGSNLAKEVTPEDYFLPHWISM